MAPGRALPDGVIDVDDGGLEDGEAKVRLDAEEQRADPAAIAGGPEPELAGSLSPQPGHELPQLGDALAQTLGGADEIGGDGKLAITAARRDAGVMVREMDEAGIPAGGVETACPEAVALVAGGGKGVKHENSGGARMRQEEEGVSAIVGRVTAGAGSIPAKNREGSAGFRFRLGIQWRRSEELGGSEAFAIVEIGLQGGAAMAIQAMTALDAIHERTHDEVERAGELAPEESHGSDGACGLARRRMGD